MTTKEERLLFAVFWLGPFGRLSNWFYKVPQADDATWEEVGAIRCKLGGWMDDLDRKWNNHYVNKGKEPNKRWRRGK